MRAALLLLLLPASVLARTLVAPTWQLSTAVATLGAIEKRSGARPLDLLEDMFDEESGLCSEGVWHNSWFGVGKILASRQLRQLQDADGADRLVASAKTLGDSLYSMSFDGSGFQRRVDSDIWQSADAAAEAMAAAGENGAFYQPDAGHRCGSSAAAVILYSMLAEEAKRAELGEASATARLVEVADAFVGEFFDTKACKFRWAVPTPDGATPYFRAVDQAMGALACLRLARHGHKLASSRAMASCAADSLLQEFGYSLFSTEGQPPGAYLGHIAARNSWHDSIACFGLLATGCLGVGGETPAGLVRAMADSYRSESGQIMHVPRELHTGGADDEVAYSSTQAMWGAVVRAADLSNAKAEAVGGADVPAVRAYFESAVHADGLLPVGIPHNDGRLWANTEFAAFLLLDRSDFGPATPS